MDETNQTAPAAQFEQQEESHKGPNLPDRLMTRFPRTTKVLTLTGAAAVAFVGGSVVKNARDNKAQLHSAADHAALAASDVTSAVSTNDSDS